ncbi:MAG TPA: hypothetical protein VGE02_08565 [Gemmatimonadales bacterium]
MRLRHLLPLVLVVSAASCAPRARPLVGAPVPAALPDTRLTGAQRILFRWEFQDGTLVARGEGVARVTAPDSARLDLFVDGGMGGGTSFLIGDRLTAPGGDMLRRMLPSPPLLWATLGRFAVPSAADTTARRDGELLRADVGTEPVYRATFAGDTLRRLERIEGGRVQEWIDRTAPGRVEYRHEASGRSLQLTITSAERVEPFDADIWQR